MAATAVAAVTASASGWRLDVGDNLARVWFSPPPVLQRLFMQLFDDRPEDVLSWMHSAVWELHKEEHRYGTSSPRKVSFRAAGAPVPKTGGKDSDLEVLDEPEERKLHVQIPPRQSVRAATAVSHWPSGVDPDLLDKERDDTPAEVEVPSWGQVESPILPRRPWSRPEVIDSPTKLSPRESRRRTSISSANSPYNPERGCGDSLAKASAISPMRGRASVSSAQTEFLSLGRWSRICTNQLSDVLDMLTDGHVRREPESWWTRLKEDRMLQVSMVDMFMGAVVVLNAATIGLSTDWHRDWHGWFVIDGIFAALFVMEIGVMLVLSGFRKFFWGPDKRWHIFETFIATLAVVEIGLGLKLGTSNPQGSEDTFTTMAPLFRIIRLCRVVRVVRLVRLTVFADLMMLIEGAIGGWKTLLWSIMIIMFPLYAVALVLRETLGEESGSASDSFSNIGASFFTVFRCVVSGECTQKDGRPIFLLVAHSYGWGYAVLYCVIMLLMTFGLFNIIIAIYVENTVAAAKFNELHQKQLRLQDRKLVRMKLQELMELVWKKCGKTIPIEKDKQFIKEAAKIEIDPEFFQELRDDRRFREIMRDLDIADEDQLDLFDTLDVDGSGTIDFEELFIGISKLRGDARRAEIVSIGLLARSLQLSFHQFDRNTTQMLRAHSRALEELKAATGTPRPSALGDIRPSLLASEAQHQRDEVGMGTPRTTTAGQPRPHLAVTFDTASQHREEVASDPSEKRRCSSDAGVGAEPVVEC